MCGNVKDHRMLNYCCRDRTHAFARPLLPATLDNIGKSVNEFGKGSRSIKDIEKDSPICPYYHGNYIVFTESLEVIYWVGYRGGLIMIKGNYSYMFLAYRVNNSLFYGN